MNSHHFILFFMGCFPLPPIKYHNAYSASKFVTRSSDNLNNMAHKLCARLWVWSGESHKSAQSVNGEAQKIKSCVILMNSGGCKIANKIYPQIRAPILK